MANTMQTIEKYCKEIKGLSSNAYLKSVAVAETRNLMVDLCRQFYTLGWLVGTGGSISIKVHDDSLPRTHQLIVMSPSGVQKERMVAEDTYVVSSDGSSVLSAPTVCLHESR